MLKDITFGQYFESNSVIHRLDPRVKLLLLIASIVFIFVCSNIFSLTVLAVFTVMLIFLSKIPFKMYLKNLKAILPIIIFTAVLNLFYSDGSKALLSFWKLSVTEGGVYRSVFMTARIVLLILISSSLTYTTTPNDLTDAIERLLSPLKLIGLQNGVHVIALMMTIALRFIPTLVEETEKIMNAQKARGADLENGSIMTRIKALIPIIIPLLISSVRRAYELAEAMECRCYNGGKGRKRLRKMTLKFSDGAACLICCVFFGSVIVVNILL